MERVMGIEPTWPAWKAGVLPLNYTRISRFSQALKYNTTNELLCQYFFAFFLKFYYLYILYRNVAQIYAQNLPMFTKTYN